MAKTKTIKTTPTPSIDVKPLSTIVSLLVASKIEI